MRVTQLCPHGNKAPRVRATEQVPPRQHHAPCAPPAREHTALPRRTRPPTLRGRLGAGAARGPPQVCVSQELHLPQRTQDNARSRLASGVCPVLARRSPKTWVSVGDLHGPGSRGAGQQMGVAVAPAPTPSSCCHMTTRDLKLRTIQPRRQSPDQSRDSPPRGPSHTR